jgi:Bifunctional DNA primase/polymerase, N-terminal
VATGHPDGHPTNAPASANESPLQELSHALGVPLIAASAGRGAAGGRWPARAFTNRRANGPGGRSAFGVRGADRFTCTGVACKLSLLLGVDEDRPGMFAEFAASIGQVAEPTFMVTTAQGCHYYYRQAEGAPLGNGRGRLAGHGINIRGGAGNGGYLVGAGSVHQTGVVYTALASASATC